MLDARARRALAPSLNAVAGRLDHLGVSPLAVTGTGWICGLAACVAAAAAWWPAALVLWLTNRLLDGLDGPLARRRGTTELGGFLDILADFSIYAGFVLGIAIARPDARLACLALLCAYYVSGTAFLALSGLLDRRGQDSFDDGRSLRFVGGLAEGTETVLVYVVLCLLPTHAAAIAWAFTAVVAITAGQRAVVGGQLLHRPAPARAPLSHHP